MVDKDIQKIVNLRDFYTWAEKFVAKRNEEINITQLRTHEDMVRWQVDTNVRPILGGNGLYFEDVSVTRTTMNFENQFFRTDLLLRPVFSPLFPSLWESNNLSTSSSNSHHEAHSIAWDSHNFCRSHSIADFIVKKNENNYLNNENFLNIPVYQLRLHRFEERNLAVIIPIREPSEEDWMPLAECVCEYLEDYAKQWKLL